MTNREHKKLLRAIRHQQEKRDNQQLAKKIDRAFSRLSEDCSNRVLKATSLIASRDTDIGGSCCLPEVAMYAAGHRKSNNVTAR
ncbi:transcriptional antitermination N peptide [Atlantibacter hermannii]|uniref:transcriptional antitermination N peptide n=1 Tax=Atlantibacter hermannii TaxID=565 RepID=UPI00406A8D58